MKPTASFGIGAVSALLLAPACRHLAIEKGLVSRPRPDRWSSHATPLLGGLAVMTAASISVLLSPARRSCLPLLCGGWAALMLGLRDDVSPLGPREKIMGLAVIYGLERGLEFWVERGREGYRNLPIRIEGSEPPGHPSDFQIQDPTGLSLAAARALAQALPLGLCLVGSNAFNLVDNMDGLLAGLAALSASALADLLVLLSTPQLPGSVQNVTGERPMVPPAEEQAPDPPYSIAQLSSDPTSQALNAQDLSLLSAAVAGSSLGFLAWNAFPARIFMGDAGSLSVGYLISRMVSYAVELGNGSSVRESRRDEDTEGAGTEGAAWKIGDPSTDGMRKSEERDGSSIKAILRVRRLAAAGLLMGIPAADSAFSAMRRIVENRPLFRGSIDHLSHSLARAGLGEPLPVLALQGLQVAACAAVLYHAQDEEEGQGKVRRFPHRARLFLFTAAATAGLVMSRAIISKRGKG